MPNINRESNQSPNFLNISNFGISNGGADISTRHSPQLQLTPNAVTPILDDHMQLSPSTYCVDGASNSMTTAGSCQFFLPNDQSSVKSFGGDSAYKNSIGGNSSLTGGKNCVIGVTNGLSLGGRSSGPVNSLRNANCSNVSTASPVQSAPMSPLSSVATSASEVSLYNIFFHRMCTIYIYINI